VSEVKTLSRLEQIEKKIAYIKQIVEEYGSVDKALGDEAKGRAAILMHLTAMAEQFDKLMREGALEVLGFFEKEDIKGSYDLRNFIAHDYEGVDLYIVEDVICERLPIIERSCEEAKAYLKRR